MDNYYDSSSSETDCESFGGREVNQPYVYFNPQMPPRLELEDWPRIPQEWPGMSSSPVYSLAYGEVDHYIPEPHEPHQPQQPREPHQPQQPREPVHHPHYEPEPEPYEPIARRLRPRPRPVYRRWPY